MTIPDPFASFSISARKRALVCFLILAIVLMTAMHRLDANLKTAEAPAGIVSFELAGNLESIQQIISSWGLDGQVRAALSLGLDYFFLVVYALFIALACAQIAKALGGNLRVLAAAGFLLAWMQFLAAVLDAVENAALIQLLLGSSRPALPLVARWCAVIKFTFVGAGLIYIIGAGLAVLVIKFFRGRSGRIQT